MASRFSFLSGLRSLFIFHGDRRSSEMTHNMANVVSGVVPLILTARFVYALVVGLVVGPALV